MHQEYTHALEEMLGLFGSSGRVPTKRYSVFLPIMGRQYKQTGLAVYGRAPNGWGTGYSELVSRAGEIARDATVAAQEHDTAWIGGYYTPFFGLIREVLTQLHGIDRDEWSGAFLWSNLMKIAPAEGGNPTDREWRTQKQHCTQLFRWELDQYTPRNVLLVTGFDWAYDFVESLSIDPNDTEITDESEYVKGHYIYQQSNILVTVRPESMQLQGFVDALSNLIMR